MEEEASKKNDQDKSNDKAKEGSSKEKDKKEKENKKKNKKNENRNLRPKASEVVPATSAMSANQGKVTALKRQHHQQLQYHHPQQQQSNPSWMSAMPMQQQQQLQQNPFAHSANIVSAGGKRPMVDASNPGASGQDSQKRAAAPSQRSNIFESCQQQVNAWQYMVVDAKNVQRVELLGKGAYAEVYKGRAVGTDCAIKLYRSTASDKQRQEAMREIRLGLSLDHPCTLRMLGWVQNPLQTITELCCGDLKAFYLNKIAELRYSEMDALRLLRVSLITVGPVFIPFLCYFLP